MFELGLRLAFDMPTIILKDDMTNYTFDINVVEHIGYPRDLNYWSIQKFKELLAKKVKATLQKKDEDDEYSPFLKAFNKKRVADIETKDVTSVEFIMDELKELNHKLDYMNRTTQREKLGSRFSKVGSRFSRQESEIKSQPFLEEESIYVDIAGSNVQTKMSKIMDLLSSGLFDLAMERKHDGLYHLIPDEEVAEHSEEIKRLL